MKIIKHTLSSYSKEGLRCLSWPPLHPPDSTMLGQDHVLWWSAFHTAAISTESLLLPWDAKLSHILVPLSACSTQCVKLSHQAVGSPAPAWTDGSLCKGRACGWGGTDPSTGCKNTCTRDVLEWDCLPEAPNTLHLQLNCDQNSSWQTAKRDEPTKQKGI